MTDTTPKTSEDIAASHVRLQELTGYKITQTVVQGEVTSIHRATGLEGDVVLKWLNVPYPTFEQLAALRNEYDILSRFDHPGILRAKGLHEVGNGLVLVIDNVQGGPVSKAFGTGPIPIKEFFSIAIQITDALRVVHEAGIIHKDINPSNILYDQNARQIKIVDFGTATSVPSQRPSARGVDVMQGTIAFMSPEQTGRINRSIDSRTDIYSLGATFYMLLTGQPPFESEDPLDVIHGHLARVPKRPSELVGMPDILSQIVMKLLSKDAEDRYQTAAGLLYDLETCERQLRETYSVNNFELATHDRSARFQMPERIYGRDAEVRMLHERFARASSGATEILLVSGESGVGKSLLIKEVQTPLIQGQGSFIEGKFDQYQRETPYSALIEAFEDLVQQLIVKGDHARWKRRLSASLGANLGVIIGVIPGLKELVGDVAAVPEVGAVEARNRFTLAFQQFVWVLADRDHPIVLFLDDLQWADQASLDLIQAILTDSHGHYFYFIGCYRDDEIVPDQEVDAVFKAIETVNPVERLTLGPLDENTIREILLDTFVERSDGANQLAEILMKKTGGNPFFLNEFLRTLHESGHLVFDDRLGEWTWNAALIAAMETTDNVSELTAARLERLPADTMEVILLAACIGSQASDAQLATKMKLDRMEIRRRLEPALHEGVLLLAEEANLGATRYSFSHDRVRDAAYSKMSEPEQWEMHLRIGRHLMQELSADEKNRRLFDIADQLNTGRRGITDRDDQIALARLNQDASKRAKSSAAFGTALRHVQIAMELMGGDLWQIDPEFAQDLYLERGECEFLNGHFDEANTFLGYLIENAKDPMDAHAAYNVLIAATNARGQFAKSIAIGIEALDKLGITFPKNQDEIGQAIGAELGQIQQHLRNMEIDSLIDLPEMTNPKLAAAVQLLVSMTSTSFIGAPELYPLIVAKQINLSIEHGNAPASSVAYSSYGVLNSPGGLSDIDTSYAFGCLALKMSDRQAIRENAVNVDFVFGTFISHWRNHLAESVTYLARAFAAALEAGNFEYVRYTATFEAFYNVLQWNDLSQAQANTAKRLNILSKIRLNDSSGAFRLANQLAETLSGSEASTGGPYQMIGPDFDEHAAEAEWKKGNDFLSLACLYASRIIISNLYRRDAETLELIEAAKPFLVASTGTFLLAEFTFTRALAFTATYDQCDEADKPEHLAQIEEDLATLTTWAEKSPQNFSHRVLILKAEIGTLSGVENALTFEETIKLYEKAGKRAREGGFLLHEGIIYERAAAFCERVNLERLATSFLQDSLYAYERMNAKPKANMLKARTDTPGQPSVRRAKTGQTMVTTTLGQSIDLERETFLRANQAISAAIRMEDLLSELIKILIKSAGAERCAVIRVEDEELTAVAQSSPDGKGIDTSEVPLDDVNWIHGSIVRYALQTRSPVVLDDAHTEGRFKDLSDVVALKSRSVLCLPIMERGKIRDLMYLSNNLSSGVFTAGRVESLKLLSGQVAVSIANAELYENLEEKVAERTNQLEVRNQLIRKEFGRYMSDEVAENLLNDPKGMSQGGEQRSVTILMADLRGFTAMADRMEARDVVRIINNFLSEMTRVILKHEGTINDFIGDAILAIFGAPVEREDDATRAIACAIDMQIAMDAVNERNVKFGLPQVSMGIGLHSGTVVVGNVGSKDRVKYGVIGQTVNLAARVESYTVGGQVLASQRTLAAAGDAVITGRDITIHPKGSDEPLTIQEVRGLKGRYDLAVPEASGEMVPCIETFEVTYAEIDGKVAAGGPNYARLIAVSAQGGAIVQVTGTLTHFRNLRVGISGGSLDTPLTNIYAKVLGEVQPQQYEIRFTSMSEDLTALLENLVGGPGTAS